MEYGCWISLFYSPNIDMEIVGCDCYWVKAPIGFNLYLNISLWTLVLSLSYSASLLAGFFIIDSCMDSGEVNIYFV